MRSLLLTVGAAVVAVLLLWAWPRDGYAPRRAQTFPAPREDRTGQRPDAQPEEAPPRLTEKPPGKPSPYADWSLERLLDRLRAVPTREAWRLRGVQENVWDFSYLHVVPKIVSEIARRFPDFEVPPSIVYRLLARGVGVSGIASWKPATKLGELKRSAGAPHDDPLWKHAALIGIWMRKRGQPIGAALARRFLEHGDPAARAEGVALAWYAEPPPVESVLAMVREDEDARVRESGLWGLVHNARENGIAADRVADIVLDSLDDPSPRVRDAAIHELPRLDGHGADAATKLARAGGLGNSARNRVVEVLLDANRLDELLALNPPDAYLEDVEEIVRDARRKRPEAYAAQEEAIREVRRRRKEIAAARKEIGKRKDEAAFLLAVASDRERPQSVRLEAVNAMVDKHPVTGTAAVRKLVLDHRTQPDLRRELVSGVIGAWGQARFSDIREILQEVARSDPNFWVRATALEAIEGLE